MSISLDQKAWESLPKTNPNFYKVHSQTDIMADLFEIVERDTPFYRFPSHEGGYNEKERDIIKDWFMSVIEGKDYSANVKGMFDCFMDRLQVKRNLKLLQTYKAKIYSKLKEHQTLDREVSLLASKSETNLEEIREF
ncbi:MAG: hypothetical protein PHG66_00510 [Candidatus Colwellbacteria bacterium]|nr:hypothetical protein [Candidatus Colwellbacteria bacterium]